jgi:hypothetical protein
MAVQRGRRRRGLPLALLGKHHGLEWCVAQSASEMGQLCRFDGVCAVSGPPPIAAYCRAARPIQGANSGVLHYRRDAAASNR